MFSLSLFHMLSITSASIYSLMQISSLPWHLKKKKVEELNSA